MKPSHFLLIAILLLDLLVAYSSGSFAADARSFGEELTVKVMEGSREVEEDSEARPDFFSPYLPSDCFSYVSLPVIHGQSHFCATTRYASSLAIGWMIPLRI